MKQSNGIIHPGDKFAKLLGFTKRRFGGYLWLIDNDIYISVIISHEEGKGNLTRLFDRIKELGYTIKVPIPMGHMRQILEKKGFVLTEEKHPTGEMIEVWVK